MKKLTLRLLVLILTVYLAGSVLPLLASPQHQQQQQQQPQPQPGASPVAQMTGALVGEHGVAPTMDGFMGGSGCSGSGGNTQKKMEVLAALSEKTDPEKKAKIAHIDKETAQRIKAQEDTIAYYTKAKADGTSPLDPGTTDRTIANAHKMIIQIKKERMQKISEVNKGG